METVKCKFCKQEIQKNISYSPKPREYYCNCEHYQLQLNKIKYKAPKTNKNGEPNERRELTDYIQKIYIENGWDKHYINWTMLMSQIKTMMSEHKLKYQGIQYILYYMYEILGINLFNEESKGSILNLVPFYKIEAEQYFIKTSDIEDNCQSFEFNDNTIVIKSNSTNNKNRKKEIDISAL